LGDALLLPYGVGARFSAAICNVQQELSVMLSGVWGQETGNLSPADAVHTKEAARLSAGTPMVSKINTLFYRVTSRSVQRLDGTALTYSYFLYVVDSTIRGYSDL